MLHIGLIPIEDISAEHIEEHYHRLAEFKGTPKEEFKSRINERISINHRLRKGRVPDLLNRHSER